MANEFVARNGLIAQNNSTVTGSLNVTSGITGSLQGTASYASQALSSSYSFTSSYVENAQTASYVTTAQTASYVLQAVSASFASTASYVETAQTASYVLQAISSSFATTASYANQALSSSYALTASYLDNYIPPFPFTGSAIISGSLEVTGSLSVSDGTYLKLDTSTHTLYDQIGAQSVNWNIRSLRDSNGNSSLNWDSRVAQDLSTITSIDWENRALFDLNTTQSVNWGERFLIDTYFANSVDWENRQLIDSTGANVILDWFNLPGTLYGTASWAESASRADSIPLAGLGFGEIQVNNGGVIGASNRIYINLATSTLHTANGGILSATGSLLGTSSYADQALSSSYALTASFALNGGGGGPAFPYTGSALVTGSIGLTGSYSNFPLVITSSTNQTIDWSQSNTFNILLTGSMTVTWSNAQNGQTLNILVTQGTAPSGNLAIWPTVNTYFPGGLIPTQSETGGKKDIYTFICIGSDIYGNYIQNY
jgi:hypothetical protein